MNYNHFHTITARTERGYIAAQSFIANDAPVLEKRLKTAALSVAVTVLEFALTVIDWVSTQLEKTDEYRLIVAISFIKSKRFAVRQLIKVAQLNQRFQITAKASKLWNRKGQIAQSALDTIFALN